MFYGNVKENFNNKVDEICFELSACIFAQLLISLIITDTQFVEITHRDAVKSLKRSRHMMLTLKHVGKLPHAKIDKMKLLVSNVVYVV